MSTRTCIVAGSLIGAMITAALIALLFLAWQLFGLPFAPFDVFDWSTRVLPGKLITFGIDTMVRVIHALHLGPTSTVAKAAEHALAIVGMFLAGTIAGGIVFAFARRRAGWIAPSLGLVLGIAVLLVTMQSGQTSTVPTLVGAIWILLTHFGWGTALGWAYNRWAGYFPHEAMPEQNNAPGLSGPSAADASVERINRHQFLIRLGGATAAITVIGAVVGSLREESRKRAILGTPSQRWSFSHPLPNADATVIPASGTRPEFTPLEQHYRIDISTDPPTIDPHQWRLQISGLVEKPLASQLEDLRRYEPMNQFVTLACISNPVAGDLTSTTRWTGVSLKKLLIDWGLKPNATHLKIHAADGFWEVIAIETIQKDDRVMLTYAWDGVPLTPDHGSPLRIYIPDHYGMKQPKWITSIEVTDHWEPGYWVERGWDKEARMKATSVIDTVSVNMMIINPQQRTLVPIGGIAHCGARGVSKVEVKVDEGPWESAELREPLSGLTWVIWRYNWSFEAGKHTFTVRCTDKSGNPQIVAPTPVRPDGAAGLHTKTEML